MTAGTRASEPAFSWPVSTEDMDGIQVVDTVYPRRVLQPPAHAPSPSASRLRVLVSGVPPVVTRTVTSAATLIPRPMVCVPAAPRLAALGQRAALIAAGVLVGVTLPLLGRDRESGSRLAVAETVAAQTAPPATAEAQGILRMRERLRRPTAAAPAANIVPSVQSRHGAAAVDMPTPAAPVAGDPGPTLAPLADPWTASVIDAWLAARAVRAETTTVPRHVGAATRRTFAEENFRPTPSSPQGPVLRTVAAYQQAWTRMDTAAAHAIWPSANTEALTRGFTSLREQRLHLGNCVVGTSGDRATAICPGTLRYRARVGDHSTRTRSGTWEFQLERTPKQWVIRNVAAP